MASTLRRSIVALAALLLSSPALTGDPVTQEHCDLMTGLLRRVRKMVDDVAAERRKPILVSARVPDSIPFAKGIGLDLERWLEEDLVDLLAGSGYIHLEPWENWVALGRKHDVPVYACLSGSRLVSSSGPEGEANLELWRKFCDITAADRERTYERLDITFDRTLGESFYDDRLAPLVEELLASGIAEESEGAVCIFSNGDLDPKDDPLLVHRDGEWVPVPCLIRKKDGGFNYATTDIATIDYRVADLSERISQRVMDMHTQQGFGRAPPPNILYIHRKLGGLYLLLKRLRARVPISELIAPHLSRRQ